MESFGSYLVEALDHSIIWLGKERLTDIDVEAAHIATVQFLLGTIGVFLCFESDEGEAGL